LAYEAGISFYSIHAGFCIEPEPNELGKPLNHHVPKAPREHYWQRFLSALKILLADAEVYGVDLFVENNVVSQENAEVPLLCTEAQECARLFIELPNPRLGFLLDTAHLKVSAKTLSFDPHQFVQQLKPHIQALHHSDNDGDHDTNEPLTDNYWFSGHLADYADRVHVLEIEDLTTSEMHRQIALLDKMIMRKAAGHD
jgi:sugar phosphate isomerase/epimerase